MPGAWMLHCYTAGLRAVCYFVAVIKCHNQKQCMEERVALPYNSRGPRITSPWGGMEETSRHRSRNRKLEDHILIHLQEAERVEWEMINSQKVPWWDDITPPASLPLLSSISSPSSAANWGLGIQMSEPKGDTSYLNHRITLLQNN